MKINNNLQFLKSPVKLPVKEEDKLPKQNIIVFPNSKYLVNTIKFSNLSLSNSVETTNDLIKNNIKIQNTTSFFPEKLQNNTSIFPEKIVKQTNFTYPIIFFQSSLICRYNIISYLSKINCDFIKLIYPQNLKNEISKISTYNSGTIIFIIDDPFKSVCYSQQNFNDFLSNPNIILCISENWIGELHPKVKLWPIGLESRMVTNEKLVKSLISLIDKKEPYVNTKILCNAHLAKYSKPASGFRDDRTDLYTQLKDNILVDFWSSKKSQLETLQLTKKYKYSLCPEGNGLDTHRFYETYAMGTIPVVRKGPLASLHSQFTPNKIINEWIGVDKLSLALTNETFNKELLTIGYWLYKSLRSRCVIINFFTGGLCEEWRNLLYTIRQQKLEDLLVVFPLDEEALECVKKEGISYRTELMNYTSIKQADYGTKEFNKIIISKLQCINIMLSEGYIVFYLDTDIILQGDIIKDFFTLEPAEIYLQSDNNFELSGKGNYCSGVMFMYPTHNIRNFFKLVESQINPLLHNDQDCINNLLKTEKLNVGTLDIMKYPNGLRYFKNKDKFTNINTLLIHNNYIVGTPNKIKRFKEHNLWFI